MADSAVNFLLQKAWKILEDHHNSIKDARSQLEILREKKDLYGALLKNNSINIHRNTELLTQLNRGIKTIVYEIEDAVEYYTAQTSKHKNVVLRYFTSPAKLLDVAKKVEAITKEYDRVMRFVDPPSGERHDVPEGPVLSSDKVVGFQKEQGTLINRLKEKKDKLDVMCIVGMPGLGKTTLANNIFTDPAIVSAFTLSQRIWITLSHDYQKKDVLLRILRLFSEVTDNTARMAVEDISQLVRQRLCALDKFFVVMDDVPSAEAWKDLKGIFSEAKEGGKVLITTQLKEVARCPNVTEVPLDLLEPDESWELLQSEAFVNSVCPRELEQHGKRIAKKCDGLPLAVVMIGKILKKRCSLGCSLQDQRMWEQVCEKFGSCLDKTDFQNANTSFYYKLPYHLMPCFLYLGMFPEASRGIKVRTLTRLWIAEGFVHETSGMSLEQTADQYLNELINRNLVSICTMGPDGDKKTCRIHCILWEFCRKQASIEGENIFTEMFEPSISNEEKPRRLCINSKVNEFFSSRPSCPLVHSLTCFYEDHLHAISISYIPKVLKYLRVLEANGITFQSIPNGWKKLALLRCVVLSINFKVIPKVISKLRNMQTLIVYTTLPEIEMKANVWKMSKLRHVETNVSTKLPKPKQGEKGDHLQTIGMVSHHSCTEDVFLRLGGLQKLGIHGKLTTLVPTGLQRLNGLEKLKLVNDLSGNNPTFGGVFPPNLRSLTLKGTKLDWNQMLTLGNLERLKVLKLKDNAFKGGSWEASAGGFSELQILHIVNKVVPDELVTWTASVNPFPKLSCLILTNTRLEEIPLSLGGDRLEKLCLEGHAENSSVVASARRILAQKSDLLVDINCSSSALLSGDKCQLQLPV